MTEEVVLQVPPFIRRQMIRLTLRPLARYLDEIKNTESLMMIPNHRKSDQNGGRPYQVWKSELSAEQRNIYARSSSTEGPFGIVIGAPMCQILHLTLANPDPLMEGSHPSFKTTEALQNCQRA